MFLNPLMLAGLGGAALPLLLHLLNRARHRPLPWGAMMFLPDADPRQRRAARLRQAILLVVRSAIVALLAVALARPVLAGRWWSRLAPAGPTCTVLLLDCSASMAAQSNGQSRFDIARRAALDVVQNASSGDEIALLLLGTDDLEHPPAPTADFRSLALRLSDATVTSTVADASAALDGALRVLRSARAAQRRIVLITDRQSSTWRRAGDDFASSWRAALAQLDSRANARPTTLSVMTAGGDEHENIAIECASAGGGASDSGDGGGGGGSGGRRAGARSGGGDTLIRDQFADIEARIHNFGDTPRTEVPISLYFGSRELAHKSITLAPRSASIVRLPVRIATPGSHVLTLRLAQQGLSADDRFDLAVDVVEPSRVLIVASSASSDAAASDAAAYVRAALMPFRAAGERGSDANVVEVVSPAVLSSTTTRPFGVGENGAAADVIIVIADARRPGAQFIRQLERFAYEGGGVILVPGEAAGAESFNAAFWRDGAGLAPAALRDAVQVPIERPGAAIAWLDTSHPAFGFARGQTAIAQPQRVRRHFPADPVVDARVIATLDDGTADGGARDRGPADGDAVDGGAGGGPRGGGDPLLIERRFGRGRVAMFTVSLDGRSSTLPFSNVFLPLMQSLARELASAGRPPRNLLPGEPIEAEIDDAIGDRATLTLPDGSRQSIEIPRIAGGIGAGDGSGGTVNGGGANGGGINGGGTHSVGANGSRPGVRVRYDRTDQTGRYELRWRTAAGDRTGQFVVRGPVEESDLAPVSPPEWKTLRARLGFDLTAAERVESDLAAASARDIASDAARADPSTDAREGWPLALAALATMLLVESLLGRWWSSPGAAAPSSAEPS